VSTAAADTPAGPQIRPATPADMPRVCEIYRHHVLTGTATFELVPPTPEEMAARFAVVCDKGFPWLVIETDFDGAGTRVAGYAYVTSFRPRPAYAWTVEDSIYLDPSAAGRGLGRALLARLIAESEAIGLRQMIAVIGDSANTPSIALHRALGFFDAGVQRAVGLKFGRWLDTVTMQRALGDGAASIPQSPPERSRVSS
jgi:L-amino acid N-acyltransferase YncA